MLQNVAIGSVLMVLTTVIHAAGMTAALKVLRGSHWKSWPFPHQLTNALLVALLVLLMFIASLLEVGAWSATYLATGALAELEPALYFSTVTFTTLGYGDVVLPDRWRLLGSFEAANGIIMFGWTTALIYAFVQRLYLHDSRSHDQVD